MKPISNAIVYDCEILRAIPDRKGAREPGIDYCEGWGDYEGMGISVICAFELKGFRYRVFLADNLAEFQTLIDSVEVVAGFNNQTFDNRLVAAHGIRVPEEKSYDILQEIWRADGLGPVFDYRTHGGYGLDAVCETNFRIRKTGTGELAPILWQKGQIGQVIDYCLNDVALTYKVFQLIRATGQIRNPKTTSRRRTLYLQQPGASKQ